MSTFVKHEAPKSKGSKWALFLGILWLALIGVIWFAYRNSEGDGGGILNFIGRFHVLIVHVPIGVIFLAFGMDLLSRLTAFSQLRGSLPFVLWISFLSACGATIVGYLLMSVEGFAGRAMDLHMYFGLAVVVCSLVALVFTIKGKSALATLGLAAAVFTTVASGHFGGAMVHDSEYLTEHAPEPIKPLLLVGIETKGDAEEIAETATVDAEEAAEIPLGERVVYTDFVVPILDKTCNECHNENKVKGKLRMDTYELLLAGADGSDFPTVVPGNVEESEMIVRVTLESDHDEFMPTKGDPLTPEEIELLSLWIAAGAKQDTTIAELGDDPSIEATALAVEAIHAGAEEVAETAAIALTSIWDTLSPEEQQQRMEDVMNAAGKYHFSLMPISAEDDRLRVNVINAAREFGDEQLALLEPVADRIVWLDLARSQITDEGLKVVSKMRGLERLHLENTAITDAGIAQLGAMTELEYLNLYGTKVGNGIFESFKKMPSLRKVYLWQTEVDPAEAKAFERSVNLEINTGVDLTAVNAAAAPAEEKKPETEKEDPKPAEKKPEPKPAPKAAPKPAPPAEKKPETPKPATTTQPAKPAPKAPDQPKASKAPSPKKADTPPKPAASPKAEAKPETKSAPKANPKPAEAAPETPAKPAPKAADNAQ